MTGHPEIVVRALTWNLFHGRDFPPDPSLFTWRSRLLRITERGDAYAQVNRPLRPEFARILEGLEWDVAVLQEAPPRWLGPLSRSCGASGVLALTSRNSLAPVRAAAAALNPDLIASNEGGSNQVLLRRPWRAVEVSRHVLTRRPEPRVLLLVRAEGPGGAEQWVGCLHASRGARDAAHDVARAAEIATERAGDRPLFLGGDFNVRPEEDHALYQDLDRHYGLRPRVPGSIDQLLVRGAEPVDAPAVLPPATRELRDGSGLLLRLSDHPIVAGSFGMR